MTESNIKPAAERSADMLKKLNNAAKAEPSPVRLSKTETIRAEAEAAAIARVHAICGSPEGLSNPDYAGELALDMNLSTAEALTRLKARVDKDNFNGFLH